MSYELLVTVVAVAANLTLALGIFLVGRQRRVGLLWQLTGSALWAVRAVQLGVWDLLAVNLFFVCLCAYSWWSWGRREKKSP